MKLLRRSAIALVLAVLLPVVAFTAAQLYYTSRDERKEIETAALSRAEQIIELIDARLEGEVRILQALSTATSLESRDLAVFQGRVRRVGGVTPSWAALVLIDAEKDLRVLNSTMPGAASIPAQRLPAYEEVKRTKQPVIGDIAPIEAAGGELAIPIYIPVRRDDRMPYVILAGIRPLVFQGIMLSKLPEGTVGGLVDREGRFIGRTVRYDEMVGKSATEFVRNAISSAKRGFYRGRTYEGFENYSTFATSPLTGWSVHLALDAALIDSPRSWSYLAAVLGGLGTVALGALMVILVLRDMAARRRSEEMMQRMQRLNALGNMTGGVAHDFNNLLAIVMGNVDMLKRRGMTQSPQLEAIRTAALRGERLIRQLLAFSRQQPLQTEVIDANARIRAMDEMLRRFLRDDIVIKLDLSSDIAPIEVDPVQLETALINLVINARDAMPKGGALAIETASVPPSASAPTGEVTIAVRDSGIGIAREVIDRVFEPFFTTKEVGKGTGLGLSMVYGFVQQSKGSAEIDSVPGHGTTVKLRFPRAVALPKVASEGARAETPQGKGSILVVEDDKEVGMLATELLEELGYKVERVSDATAALRVVESGGKIDLVFSDVIMPGKLSGIDLARELRRKRPDLAVLLTTGYAASAGEPSAEGFAVLAKPYTVEALAEAVRRSLERRDLRRKGAA